MRYTQSQVRELLAVSGEAFRRWRNAIPALALRKGHGPAFSPGDLVALALISDLINQFGLRVNTIAARFDELFEICNAHSWPVLEACAVAISGQATRIMRPDEPQESPGGGESTLLLIPLRPVVKRLQARLISAAQEDPQARLQFPPVGVKVEAR